MFEKIFNVFFYKTEKKNRLTLLSYDREIKADLKTLKKVDATAVASIKNDMFWDNRGRYYGALFTSLNGRQF